MRALSYLKALLAVQSFALCASAALRVNAQDVLQQITKTIRVDALRNGRLGHSLEAQATSPKAYAVTYMYASSDCSEDSVVGALALASNRCIPVELEVPGVPEPVPSSARLRCGEPCANAVSTTTVALVSDSLLVLCVDR
jgi:hypothetical protein